MNVAVSTWSYRERFKTEPDFDIFRALEYTAELGFSAIEILTGKADNPPEHIGDDTVSHLERVKRHAQELGIRIVCFATYNDFAYTADEQWRLANIAYIKKWLRLAGEVEVPNIRMLTGYHTGDSSERTHQERLVEAGIRECVPEAEKAGVRMAIENHSSVFFTGEALRGLIERIGSDYLTTCPDPSNGYKVFDPACPTETREAMYANLELMMPLATHAHLKIRGVHDGALEGVDVARLVSVYRAHDYHGAIAFEGIEAGTQGAVLREARVILERAIANA
jgi:L-ribulose-5-phosphate 3-epimerase